MNRDHVSEEHKMIRIHVDFTRLDNQGRVKIPHLNDDARAWLHLGEDVGRRSELTDGMRVIFCEPEFEVVGTLICDNNEWRAIPDWDTIRYFDDEEPK